MQNAAAQQAVAEAFVPSPPVIVSAVSRKAGAAGTSDLPINLTGIPSVDPRGGGPTQLVLTFSSNIVIANPDQLSGATSYLNIPQGYVAIALPAGEQIGVAGYIAKGDYIDIIATVNTQMFALARPRSVTKTVFFGVHVLKVGPAAPVATQGQVQGVSSSITVVMTQCDAAYMNWLLANVTLRYTLQSFKDYGQAESAKAAACSSTDVLNSVGPAAVNERWNFLQGL